jgi:hypothetical protein
MTLSTLGCVSLFGQMLPHKRTSQDETSMASWAYVNGLPLAGKLFR